jgi:hypothetical protein
MVSKIRSYSFWNLRAISHAPLENRFALSHGSKSSHAPLSDVVEAAGHVNPNKCPSARNRALLAFHSVSQGVGPDQNRPCGRSSEVVLRPGRIASGWLRIGIATASKCALKVAFRIFRAAPDCNIIPALPLE